jgi:hypothetical protein
MAPMLAVRAGRGPTGCKARRRNGRGPTGSRSAFASGSRRSGPFSLSVHHSLLYCTALRALLAHHGATLDGGVSGTEPAATTAETLEARSALHGNSLDPPHLLVLAHVLRRPVVCYASASVGEVREVDAGRTFSSYAAKGERMSGVYLPCLLSPDETSRDPIVLAYTPGHFTVLVNSEAAADGSV